MARAFLIVALALVCILAVADAQCIACKDCKGSNACLSMCKPSCEVTVNVENCKNYGVQAGKDVAKFACDLTLNYCRANKVQPRSYMKPQKVTLQQCANAAYGVCQSTATSSSSPCYKEFNGVATCSKSEFKTFYEMIVDEQCNIKVAPFDKPQGKH